MHRIVEVSPGSPAFDSGIKRGDALLSVNGQDIKDVFDYRFLIADEGLGLVLERDGGVFEAFIEKDADEDLGLEFETDLMDSARSCENNCVFCFVAQNPPNVRSSLRFKDDDYRLSFLTGSYITMTNMRKADFKRLLALRFSPVNISVHAVSKRVRGKLLRNKRAGKIWGRLKKLERRGIDMNFQIVLVKGVNDGAELERSVKKLTELMPRAKSLSVVPAGLTSHRDGLYPIEPMSADYAADVISAVEALASGCRDKFGTSFVWAADELYVKAGLPVPSYDSYEDFPQLENGVGMMALFLREFDEAMAALRGRPSLSGTYCVATGAAAESFMAGIAKRLTDEFPALTIAVRAIPNKFFGESVTVSGLVTGGDIVKTLEGGLESADALLIPENMLIKDGDVFLDDMSVSELEAALGVKVAVVPVNGAEFFRFFCD